MFLGPVSHTRHTLHSLVFAQSYLGLAALAGWRSSILQARWSQCIEQSFGSKPVSGSVSAYLSYLATAAMAAEPDGADSTSASVAASKLFAQERKAAKDSVVSTGSYVSMLSKAVEMKTIALDLDNAYDLVQRALEGHLS